MEGALWASPACPAFGNGANPAVDTVSVCVEFPFEFELFGVPFTQFGLNLSYGAGVGLSGISLDSPVISNGFNPTDLALVDRGIAINQHLSPIIFNVSGDAPNRVVTIEVKNAGSALEVIYGPNVRSEIGESFFNFQMRFYEIDNSIEVHYGPRFLSPNTNHYLNGSRFQVPIPDIALTKQEYPGALSSDSFYIVVGSYDAPRLKRITFRDYLEQTGFDSLHLDQVPLEDFVYRYSPVQSSGIDESFHSDVHVGASPNPVASFLSIVAPDHHSELFRGQANVTIIDALGRQVATSTQFVDQTIDVSTLNSGVYYVVIRSGSTVASARFVKQ